MPETIKCVHCDAPLRLPEQFIGQEVRCPSCQKSFTARLPTEPTPPARPPRTEPAEETYEVESPPRRPPGDNERPSKRRRRRDEGDDDEDYPRRKRPRYDDDYPSGRYRLDDRSGLILTLGIVSLVLLPLGCACGPLALASMGLGLTAALMGRSDLAQIKSGERNPAGEGKTNGGMICGLIAFVIGLIVILFGCVLFGVNLANQ
jgi:hypothetical protein